MSNPNDGGASPHKLDDAGLRAHARLPLILTAVLLLICAATAWDPPSGRLNWALEVGPGLAMVVAFGAVYKRFPVTHLTSVFIFLHILILIYGGYYTYALTPLGEWAKEAFGFSRNHYDRVGHVALGFFPAITIREVLLRQTPLRRGGWLFFLVTSVALAIGAFWELIEWWTTLLVASDVGQAFLGSQGDIWDAQWDMFLAWVGAGVSLLLFGKLHDRSLKAVCDV